MAELLRRRRAPERDLDPETAIRVTEAGRRLAAWDAGPTPPLDALRARRARRARQRRFVTATAAVCVTVVAVGAALLAQPGTQRVRTSSTTGRPQPTRPHTQPGTRPHPQAGSRPPVEMAIHLDRTVVGAGTAIDGRAVLTNTTHTTITVEACQPPPSRTDGWLFVGLANSTIHYNPAVATPACAPSIRLHPGVNRFPITVQTTYQSCTSTRTQATTQEPTCTIAGPPPLPPGRYTTRVLANGLPKGWRAPAPMHVTLLQTANASPANRLP